jgi:hypothetical protein
MTIVGEIIAADNAIQAVINTLESVECKIKCKDEVRKLLTAAIMEMDAEMESMKEDASR